MVTSSMPVGDGSFGVGMDDCDVRPASADQLARLYAAVAEREPTAGTAVPAVVFVGTDADPALARRLHQFGVDVHAVDAPDVVSAVGRGACLLGTSMHASWVPLTAPEPQAEHGPRVAALVERARLRDWAGDIRPEPLFTTLHRPGSDSRGVVQFGLDGAEFVAKIGDHAAIAGEVAFAGRVNALLADDGSRGLFPEVHGVRAEGGQAISLMEAGDPMPLGPLFADDARTVLSEDAVTRLGPHLERVAAWYRLTVEPRRPTVADYLYRERYHVLREHPDVVSTFASLFPDLRLADMLAASVRLPGGAEVPGYDAMTGWLDEVAPALLPGYGTGVHGDIYAANMLIRADGSPVLIDPRTVWDGRDRPDVGYGDPVFDLATLLHGAFPMAAVLRAVETGTADGLLPAPVRPRDGRLDLSGLRLPSEFPPAVRALEARMLAALPRDEPRRTVRTRLYIGAATSLAGWLKYERSLRTPPAWLATFAYVIWYLETARRLWEERGLDGELDS